jgi:hypothetical protein
MCNSLTYFILYFSLDLLIRSHEVKKEGYEIEYNGKYITVFLLQITGIIINLLLLIP